MAVRMRTPDCALISSVLLRTNTSRRLSRRSRQQENFRQNGRNAPEEETTRRTQWAWRRGCNIVATPFLLLSRSHAAREPVGSDATFCHQRNAMRVIGDDGCVSQHAFILVKQAYDLLASRFYSPCTASLPIRALLSPAQPRSAWICYEGSNRAFTAARVGIKPFAPGGSRRMDKRKGPGRSAWGLCAFSLSAISVNYVT